MVTPLRIGRELRTNPPPFPDPRETANGPVAVGGSLAPETLLLAYRSGIFPWSVNPITWWSPHPRGIFELDRFHVARSLARVVRQQKFRVTINQAFPAVIKECSEQRSRGTWITPEFIAAYTHLHTLGHAHSVECWQNQQLVGGVYGVAIGGLFAGESMFHTVSDASKVALFHLVEHLRHGGFQLFDAQMLTPVTVQLGAVNISRDEYLRRLADAVDAPGFLAR